MISIKHQVSHCISESVSGSSAQWVARCAGQEVHYWIPKGGFISSFLVSFLAFFLRVGMGRMYMRLCMHNAARRPSVSQA
ncbi:hypothetical protein M422DRAFT_24162 [Sphaerobolus stellatus SS14]|nr:hypothetical protein M422DRAFT_24162 [Sphaerobolus stellatus SS14]